MNGSGRQRRAVNRLKWVGCWLVAGCLFQTVWNLRSGAAGDADIKDCDLLDFDDSDLSEEAELRMQAKMEDSQGDPGDIVEMKTRSGCISDHATGSATTISACSVRVMALTAYRSRHLRRSAPAGQRVGAACTARSFTALRRRALTARVMVNEIWRHPETRIPAITCRCHDPDTLADSNSIFSAKAFMQYQRTEKARIEFQPGVRNLGVRERSFLLIADGTKSLDELRTVFGAEFDQIVTKLVHQQYLEPRSEGTERRLDAATRPADVQPQTTPKTAGFQVANARTTSSDGFEGKRSLATTRMFLFDICERMFTRRSPELAEQYREALRQSRDRDSMLQAARLMIAEIERLAGPERADSISERIAMLLPPEAGN